MRTYTQKETEIISAIGVCFDMLLRAISPLPEDVKKGVIESLRNGATSDQGSPLAIICEAILDAEGIK